MPLVAWLPDLAETPTCNGRVVRQREPFCLFVLRVSVGMKVRDGYLESPWRGFQGACSALLSLFHPTLHALHAHLFLSLQEGRDRWFFL